MRTVSLMGSTGSVGTQALDVIRTEPERFRVHALAAQRSVEELLAQAAEFGPELVVIGDPGPLRRGARRRPGRAPRSWWGRRAWSPPPASADVVLNAVVGFAGLPVTMAALEAGKRLALANKESLIAGAPVVQKARRTPGAEIVPVDSEHCAVHQCLACGAGRRPTWPGCCSRPRAARSGAGRPSGCGTVTVADALAHPTWSMGPKITIDSSTLMNKGLEVIEAHELFGIDYDRIDIVVHPQSIVHSMVELRDGSTLAQLSDPDMRLPIGYALGWPDRAATPFGALDWSGAADPDLRAARPRRLPLHRPGLRGGPARRLRPGLAQRGQRGGRRGVPGQRAALGRHRRRGGRDDGRRGWTTRWTRWKPCWRPMPRPGPGPAWRWTDAWPWVAAGSVGAAMTLTEKEAPAAQPPLEPDPAPDDGNPARVVQLLVALVLITAVFIALGWGYLLLFIAILFAIVMLHEFGHFVTAKRAGMKVTEYFVGFGPRLWSVRRGETEYGVKAIPAGGYVRITGFTSTEEVPEEDEPRAYRQQPFHQRIIVASAGSAMHFLIAFVLALILVFTFGKPTNNYKVASLEHWPGRTTPAAAGRPEGRATPSSPSTARRFTNPNSMTDAIKRSVGKPLTLGVERDGKLIHLTATPENGKGIKVDGAEAGQPRLPGRRHRAPPPRRSAPLDAPAAAPVDTMWQVTDAGGRAASGQTLLAARARLDLAPADQLQGAPSPPPTTPARPRGPSPSWASPTSARSRSRPAWPRS